MVPVLAVMEFNSHFWPLCGCAHEGLPAAHRTSHGHGHVRRSDGARETTCYAQAIPCDEIPVFTVPGYLLLRIDAHSGLTVTEAPLKLHHRLTGRLNGDFIPRMATS
jgi:hypothetical protein